MGDLTIHSASTISKIKKLKGYLDDCIIGEVLSEETATIEVPEGKHTLQIKYKLFGSKKIEINVLDQNFISIRESAFHHLIMPISFAFFLFNMIMFEPLGWSYAIYGFIRSYLLHFTY